MLVDDAALGEPLAHLSPRSRSARAASRAACATLGVAAGRARAHPPPELPRVSRRLPRRAEGAAWFRCRARRCSRARRSSTSPRDSGAVAVVTDRDELRGAGRRPRRAGPRAPRAPRRRRRRTRRRGATRRPRPRAGDRRRRRAAAPHPTRAEDPAYLVYTSGTTGHPKGVLHAHRALLGRQPSSEYWFDFRPDGDRVLHAGRLNWTYVLGTGMMDPLYRGHTAILAEGAIDARRWLELLARHAATTFIAVPTIYRQILEKTAATGADVPALRHCMCAGEPLPPEVLAAWRARFGLEIYEALGMTECSYYLCQTRSRPIRPGSVGFAQPGHDVRLLDPDDARRGPGRQPRACSASPPTIPASCSATGTSRRRPPPCSATAGSSPATTRARTPTATSGSSAGATTSSTASAIASRRTRWSAS